MRHYWWKFIGGLLVLYSIIGGFLFPVPRIHIVNETVRNQHFHVTMWFCLLIILTISLIYSILYLRKGQERLDDVAVESANMGLLLGTLGLITGMEWANFTWGAWWSGDVKQNMTLILLLIYAAYLVLRSSFNDESARARISAVYNIFAFACIIPLLIIIPRMYDSLHPGSGGNPGFKVYDLDFWLRIVFYPAVLGWTLLSLWIIQLRIRLRQLNRFKLRESLESLT